MKPPSPPRGALASRVPPMRAVPDCMSAIRRISPFSPLARVWARTTPVLFTVALASASTARAVRYTRPPSARIAPPLSTSASSTPAFTCNCAGPPRSRVTSRAAASRTAPPSAVMLPVFTTWAAISATAPPWAPPVAARLPWFTTGARLLPDSR